MFRGAHPQPQLLIAPLPVRRAFVDFANHLDSMVDLWDDILDRFDSPVLSAALSRLIEIVEKKEQSDATYRAAGFTSDDAFTYHKYESCDEVTDRWEALTPAIAEREADSHTREHEEVST